MKEPRPDSARRGAGQATGGSQRPRKLPVVLAILAVLLLADIGFVLMGSSSPAASVPSDTPLILTVTEPAQVDPTSIITGVPPDSAAVSQTIPAIASEQSTAPARIQTGSTAAISSTPTVSETTVVSDVGAVSGTATVNGTLFPATSPPVESSADTRPVITPTSQDDESAFMTVHNTFRLSCDDTAGKLLSPTLKSRVLATSLLVNVYLPPCYDPERYSYPTLYLIQGLGYVSGEWVEDGAPDTASRLIASGRLPPFIIIMPANDSMSGYASRYVYTSQGQGSWEDFIVNELVPWVDGHYSTWNDRAGRAIGGISRGGYWSLMIGFSHADLFSVVGGHSPAIEHQYLLGTGVNFSMLSFTSSIDVLRKLRIYLDAGAGDVTQTGVYQLAAELGQNGITYTGSIGDGVHNDIYWSSRIGDYLMFYSADWPRTPRRRST